MQRVSPLPRFVRIQPGIRPSRLLLVLQILGAVIPVADFLREAVLHRCLGFGDQCDLARPDLFEVLRHHIGDRVRLRLLLKVPADPGALRAPNDRRNVGFVGTQRPIVQVRRIMEVSGDAGLIHLDVEHPLGDNPAVPCSGCGGILDSVLKIEQHPRLGSCVALVDEHCPSTQQIHLPPI